MCVCRQWICFRVTHPSCCIVDVPISLTPISERPLPDSRGGQGDVFNYPHRNKVRAWVAKGMCLYTYYCCVVAKQTTSHFGAFDTPRHHTNSYYHPFSVNDEMLRGQDQSESRAVCCNDASMVYYLYTTDDGNRIIVEAKCCLIFSKFFRNI